jgi:hypothetical protein
MIALIAFCLLSQEIKSPADIKIIFANANGETKTEKALNGVEEVCKRILKEVTESKLVKEDDKKKLDQSFQDVSKSFNDARKDKKPESYSYAIGKMSFYFRVVLRIIPNQPFQGNTAESLRNICFDQMDAARK